jgi:hypothetical protein
MQQKSTSKARVIESPVAAIAFGKCFAVAEASVADQVGPVPTMTTANMSM